MDTVRSQQIVVIDDEAVVVSLTCDALEAEGYRVASFTDPQLALDFMHDHSVDLIITDIRMPQMSGIEVIAHARQLQPDVLVIFMTGFATLNSAKEAIKQGAADYILKPFELHELRGSVARALEAQEKSGSRQAGHHLSKLTAIGDDLFTATDRTSIAGSFLRYSAEQFKASHVLLVVLDGDIATEYERTDTDAAIRCFPVERQLTVDLFSCMREQQIREAVELDTSHQVCRSMLKKYVSAGLFPDSVGQPENLIMSSYSGSVDLSCLLLLRTTAGRERFSEASLATLTVLTRQFGMTLENQLLLQRSESARASLEALQDQIIDMERLATRGQLAAEIGHEMNNFLSIIAGNVSLITMHAKKQKHEPFGKPLEAIQHTIERMTRFTSDLMNHATGTTAREEISLAQVLLDAVDAVRPQKRFRAVEITVNHTRRETLVQADQTQLQQVFYNLLNNAADAMRSSKVRQLTVRLDADQPEEDTATIEITDTGCGFSRENLARAFSEKFTTKEHGHGFGLLVCRRLIESHGGTLTATSTEGLGTTMRITLPLLTRATSGQSAAG